jgi:hypothetical protein
MEEYDDTFMEAFDEMQKMGLATSGNLWIETAIEQRSSQLPITIANSRLLTYDLIDRKITSLESFN